MSPSFSAIAACQAFLLERSGYIGALGCMTTEAFIYICLTSPSVSWKSITALFVVVTMKYVVSPSSY